MQLYVLSLELIQNVDGIMITRKNREKQYVNCQHFFIKLGAEL